MKKVLSLTLASLILITCIASASHEGERAVPIMEDDEGESALDMYAKRHRILFVVIDCSTDQLLWDTSQEVADVWMTVTPIRIELELEKNDCLTGSFGNSISEIYWSVAVQEETALAGDYRRHYNTQTRDIIEEDLVLNQLLVIQQARDLQTTTPIVLYNGLMHLMGNAMGLGDANEIYPEDCNWSVMLANCAKSRNPPQNADISAAEHIYFKRPEMEFQVDNFDQNGNGVIDREELNIAIDLWVFGALQDEIFIELVTWWDSQETIPQVLNIHQASVTIFTTNGDWVFRQPCTNYGRLNLNTLVTRARVEVGAYVALIRDCQTGKMAVKMIAKLPNE